MMHNLFHLREESANTEFINYSHGFDVDLS